MMTTINEDLSIKTVSSNSEDTLEHDYEQQQHSQLNG